MSDITMSISAKQNYCKTVYDTHIPNAQKEKRKKLKSRMAAIIVAYIFFRFVFSLKCEEEKSILQQLECGVYAHLNYVSWWYRVWWIILCRFTRWMCGCAHFLSPFFFLPQQWATTHSRENWCLNRNRIDLFCRSIDAEMAEKARKKLYSLFIVVICDIQQFEIKRWTWTHENYLAIWNFGWIANDRKKTQQQSNKEKTGVSVHVAIVIGTWQQ